MRLAAVLIAAALAVWATTFAAVLGWQVLWPRDTAPPARGDAIVCLGAGMSPDGPAGAGPASARRARTCADLYAAGAAPVVVFTGAGDETRSAAEAMARVAMDVGLPAAAARVEPEAQSTIQNAAFGLAMLAEAPDRVIVVSDAFHLPRAWTIFRLVGVDEVALHAVPRDEATWPALLRPSIREAVAIWFNAARLAAYGAGGLVGIDHDRRIGWFN